MSFAGIAVFMLVSVVCALCIGVLKSDEGGTDHGHHGHHGHH